MKGRRVKAQSGVNQDLFILVLFPKKNSQLEVVNYRPVSILPDRCVKVDRDDHIGAAYRIF